VLALPADRRGGHVDRLGLQRRPALHAGAVQGVRKIHKNIRFKYIADGGNAGVKDVQAGRFEFSINTRPPEPATPARRTRSCSSTPLCIDVNSANSISNVSLSDLKNIFLGVDTSWSQVPGSNLSTTIDPIGRNSAAGLYTFFQQSVLGGATQAGKRGPGHVRRPSSRSGVGRDPNAIGYVGLAHSGKPAKALTVNGVPCQAIDDPQQVLPAVPL